MRNFQADAVEQGRWFEDYCQRVLTDTGFAIAEIHLATDAGINVDFVAHGRHEIAFYFTCKGSYRGRRPGARRTDTLKKAVAEALLLHTHGWGPVVLLTSHLPDTTTGRALLAGVDPQMLFDALDIHVANQRLGWLAQASEAQLLADLQLRRMAFLARLGRLGVPPVCFSRYRSPRERAGAARQDRLCELPAAEEAALCAASSAVANDERQRDFWTPELNALLA